MSTTSLPSLELPPLQSTQLGKRCISVPIFAFNTVKHSCGSERHKAIRKPKEPGLS